jgi:UDP-glucose 4-epimerase
MRQHGVKDIAFASSSVVYGEGAPLPTPEDHGPCIPISLYGASKAAGEGLIGAYVGTFGFRAWIFRFANIIGGRGTHGVIFDFIHKLVATPERLEVLGDGRQENAGGRLRGRDASRDGAQRRTAHAHQPRHRRHMLSAPHR